MNFIKSEKMDEAPEYQPYYCEFEIENDAEYECRQEAIGDVRLCIFHVWKRSETEMNKLDFENEGDRYIFEIQEDFKEEIKKLIEDAVSTSNPKIDFRGFQFPKMKFPPVSLSKEADFSNAVFHDEIDFSQVTDNADGKQTNGSPLRHSLVKGANFDNTHFKGKATFAACEIESQISFTKAVFDSGVDFSGAKIRDLSFGEVNVNGSANFTELTTRHSSEFSGSTFNCLANFTNAEFGTRHDLSSSGAGENRHTTAPSSTNFENVTFNENVTFLGAVFHNNVSFVQANFIKGASFYGVKEGMFRAGVDFRSVIHHKDTEIVFDSVHFEKARFHETNLEKIVFRNVTWGSPQSYWRRLLRGDSFILWDEFEVPDEHRNDAKTAENYRQLVLNFESKRDYESAEFFHIGEMEMRRRGVGRGTFLRNFRARKYLNSYGLYWASSRYGTSYTQAFIILVFAVCFFSLLHLYAGLKSSPENPIEANHIIDYNLFTDETHVFKGFRATVTDFGRAVSYIAAIVTFQKERFYEPMDWHSRILLFPTVLVLAAQSAMLLFAIRRRFKR